MSTQQKNKVIQGVGARQREALDIVRWLPQWTQRGEIHGSCKVNMESTQSLSTAYHPQTSGHVEVSNRGLNVSLKGNGETVLPGDAVKHIATLKQALRGRQPMAYRSCLTRIVKALVFSVLSIRSLELQILSFILGIPIS
ncbi:hypothetical protein Tco_0248266 [Tanacetum coccineum]|uniref:Uncharacterized protein n=1 Tax=Tanacetum coccineum TaxID=301880 RepID=A0ABQ4Z2T5_9ASTR